MLRRLALTALVVRDYDEAITFYVDCLGFELRSDRELAPGRRWVVVAPRSSDAGVLPAKATSDGQTAAVGCQSGGRVFLFLETDDFGRDYPRLKARGIKFCEEPRQEEYGTVVVFEDLYGNKWDLIQPA